jgi:hypothetical protein
MMWVILSGNIPFIIRPIYRNGAIFVMIPTARFHARAACRNRGWFCLSPRHRVRARSHSPEYAFPMGENTEPLAASFAFRDLVLMADWPRRL